MHHKRCDVLIAGAGLSGLSVGHFLKKFRPELDVMILEKSSRPGGAIQSLREDGFVAEWGAHGFLNNVAESRELLEDLDIEDETVRAPLGEFVRYACLNGKLVQLPQTPKTVVLGKYMPLPGKLRVLAEPWKKPLAEEQTVAQWAEYRFGKAILPLVDAAATGTYAGDMERLSMDAVMPGLRRMEQGAGSIIRGVIGMMRQSRTQGAKTVIPSMVSFKNGMETLVEALAAKQPVVLGAPVEGLARGDGGWLVTTPEGTVSAGKVVLALQINQALPLLSDLKRPPVKAVPEASLLNVVMGFGREARIPFGFGFLAPRGERRFVLGAMFSSHMFPGHRSPGGRVLLEALVAGRLFPEKEKLEDRHLINHAYHDICRLIDLPEFPLFARVLRPDVPIPQLELGHLQVQKWRDDLESASPGLHVCGFGWEGIGINDMVKKARAVAQAVATDQRGPEEKPKARGVYF